jgi:hypothetical protein
MGSRYVEEYSMDNEARKLQLQVELESIRRHGRHMHYVYSIRWGIIGLAALALGIGAMMTFKGLTGSFNWAFEAPHSIGAKLTNASPGIIFATIGFLLGFTVTLQNPLRYETRGGRRSEFTLGPR